MTSRNRWMILSLMGLFALTACDDTTGPGQTFDPGVAAEDYEAMSNVVSSPEWDDFRTATLAFSYGEGQSQDVPAALAQTLDGLDGLRNARGEDLARNIISHWGELPTSAQAIISETHRGVTFEWSTETLDYYAGERAGAPTNGVRFILYELDANDAPIVENEIGFVDLLDEGDDVEPVILRLSATANNVNFLDYRVELSNPEVGSGSLAIDGFLRNDVDQLDFDIDVAASQSQNEGEVDITFTATMDSRNFEIALALDGVNDASGESAALSLSVTHGAHSIAVDGSVVDGVLDATIALNGEDWVTMTGDP
ncbi:MAG: hypothetical protein OEO23_02465, partial [Gemmatimonadota bacterium]|nr:hypothetical protein [Gemmatimonadota bacterium]